MHKKITEEIKSLFDNSYGNSEKKLNIKLWGLAFIIVGIFIMFVRKIFNYKTPLDNIYPQKFNKLVVCWFITTILSIFLTTFSFILYQNPIKKNEKNIYKYFKTIFLALTLTITIILLSPAIIIKLIIDAISNKTKVSYLKHLEINLLIIEITLIALMFLVVIVPVSISKIWMLLCTKFNFLNSLSFIGPKTLIYLSAFTIALILKKIIGFAYKKLIKRELKIVNINNNNKQYNEHHEQEILERYTKEIYVTTIFMVLIFTFIFKALDFSQDKLKTHMIDSIFYTTSIFTLATTLKEEKDDLDKDK